MQDRKRLLAICPDPHSNLPSLPPPNNSNPPSSGAAPILINNSSNNANNANHGASCSGSLKEKKVKFK